MKKIIVVTLILFFALGVASGPVHAAATKQKTVTSGQYFHKRKLVHKKAPIPKDPKVTKADLKKAKQQAIASKGYVKVLKGWLNKKKPIKKYKTISKNK